MRKILLFAVSTADAQEWCNGMGVTFESVTWVMNWELLGGQDYSDHEVYYTPMFKLTPAYAMTLPKAGPEHV